MKAPLSPLGFLLLVATLLTGCATPLPESAYYRYAPESPGELPARLSAASDRGTGNPLLFLMPTSTSVVGVDGKPVQASYRGAKAVLLTPRTHAVSLRCQWDDYLQMAELTASFSPGVEYAAKTRRSFDKATPYIFFIEEKATKRRVAEGLPKASGIAPRIRVPIFVPPR